MKTKSVNVNDIKQGIRIRLRNGWQGTMQDNKRGQTRLCLVEGLCTEVGSVYATDIVGAKIKDEWMVVDYPEKYIEDMAMRKLMGF